MKILKICLAFIISLIFVSAHTACAANLSALAGTYKYANGTGGLKLTKQNNKLAIQLDTVVEPSYNTCLYEGICTEQKGKIICLNEDFKDDKELYVVITQIDAKTISIDSSGEYFYCGNNAYFTGKYVKK